MEHLSNPDDTLHDERVLVIDFGSQVTQLIARRLREAGVYCEIHPFNRVDAKFLDDFAPRAIILSGGPASVNTARSPRAAQEVFERGVPILGICYGEQLICEQLGGEVENADHKEFGRAEIEIQKASPLFDGVWREGGAHTVWMSHGDHVANLPNGFSVVATSPGAPFAVIADENRHYYGVQFHPEVVHTQNGADLLKRFALGNCGCSSRLESDSESCCPVFCRLSDHGRVNDWGVLRARWHPVLPFLGGDAHPHVSDHWGMGWT